MTSEKLVTQILIPNQVSITKEPGLEIPYLQLGCSQTPLEDIPQNQKARIRFHYELHPNPIEMADGDLIPFSSYYQIGANDIYYEKKYGGLCCKLLIKGLNTDAPNLYINKTYHRLVRFKIDNLYPSGLHITDIALLNMLQHKCLLMHAAALQSPEASNAIMIVAPPDTGKTFTSYSLIKQGFKFLSEDLIHYDCISNELSAIPYTSTWGHRYKTRKSIYIPFLSLFISSKNQTITVKDIFNEHVIVPHAPLGKILILEKSSETSIKKISYNDNLLNQIVSIQRNEFSYFKNPLLRAWEYFHTKTLNIDSLYALEHTLITNMLKSNEIILISANEQKSFPELIQGLK